MEKREWIAVGRLVRQYRLDAKLTQAPVLEMLRRALPDYPVKINQGLIHSNENGKRWTPELAAAYARVLGIPSAEMRDAMYGPNSGYPSEGVPRRTTWREVIEADPSLSAAAKAHLIAQYGLLQLASRQEQAGDSVSDADEGHNPRSSNG